MENLNFVISQNLKRIREDMHWSLDKLSQETGVSKSMLGQIERGESNPTVATVWKISNGLKVSFTTLLNHPREDAEVVRAEDVDIMIEDGGKYKVYAYFNYESSQKFESYKIEILSGGKLFSEPHSKGTVEYVTVFDGRLTLTVEDKIYHLNQGDAIHFKSDKTHQYENNSEEKVRLNMIVYYPDQSI